MQNPEQPKKGRCKLYLPMSFNPQSRQRLKQLIQSPNNINFFPNHKTTRCHQNQQLTLSPKSITIKIPFTERANRFQNKQKNKQTKWSISRMLQRAKPQVKTINYISKLYKQTGQKQIVIRKCRQRSDQRKSFAKDLLEYKSIKLKIKKQDRYIKTSEQKHRYHYNSQTVEARILTTNQEPRIKIKKIATPEKVFRKTLVFTKPDNWVVDSWNSFNKFENIASQI